LNTLKIFGNHPEEYQMKNFQIRKGFGNAKHSRNLTTFKDFTDKFNPS
jgi:hypothetical protein